MKHINEHFTTSSCHRANWCFGNHVVMTPVVVVVDVDSCIRCFTVFFNGNICQIFLNVLFL
jgi:hypothetical protein